MKKTLLSLLSIILLGFNLPLQAKESVWNVYVLAAPGSGDHRMIMALAPVAAKDGVRFNIQFPKGCRSIVSDLTAASGPTISVTPGPLYYPGQQDAECFFPSDSSKLLHFAGVMSSSINLCSVPGKAWTMQDIASGRELRIGVGKDSAPYLRRLVAAMGSANNVKILIYRGTGDIVRASVAGDIDLWFGAAVIRQQPGAHCIGASLRDNALNLPFLGDVVGKPAEFLEVSDSVALTAAKHNLSTREQALLRSWLNSADFQAWRKTNLVKGIDHNSDQVERIIRQWSQLLATP